MQRPPLVNDEGEVRELTDEELKRLRPIAEVDPGMVEAMKDMRNKGGRPRLERPKVQKGFRIAADLVEGIEATGKGYNVRVERVLRKALAAGELDAPRDLVGQAGPKR